VWTCRPRRLALVTRSYRHPNPDTPAGMHGYLTPVGEADDTDDAGVLDLVRQVIGDEAMQSIRLREPGERQWHFQHHPMTAIYRVVDVVCRRVQLGVKIGLTPREFEVLTAAAAGDNIPAPRTANSGI
jgi:hypothetical protein